MHDKNFIQLYKYLPFNADSDVAKGKDSLRVLKEGTIKFTHPKNFNDPFDCRPTYSDDFICGLLDRHPAFMPELARLVGVISENGNENFSAAFRALRGPTGTKAIFNLFLSKAGVFCLSENPYDILMWSHYADYHRGFIVGFKVPKNGVFIPSHEGEPPLSPVKVFYEKERPEIQHGSWTEIEISRKHLFSKSDHWEREGEYRVVSLRRGDGAYKFNPDTLNFVVSGMNADERDRQRLKECLKKFNRDNCRDAQFFDASPCERQYRVNIPGLDEFLSK